MRCLIITKNGINANALKRQLLVPSEVPPPEIDIFIAKAPTPNDWRVTDEFNRICDWIESTACGTNNIAALRDTVVITDLAPLHFGEGSTLNPCKKVNTDEEGWAPLLAMLILAFPEIHWAAPYEQCGFSPTDTWSEDALYRFAHTLSHSGANCHPLLDSKSTEDAEFYDDDHYLGSKKGMNEVFRLKREGYIPLFDPSGLRNRIRHQIVNDVQAGHKDVPIRTQQALAIDEERSYAFLHAYTAYRFGFRSHVVTSETMMKWLLFQKKLATIHTGTDYKTKLEDTFAIEIGSNYLVFEDLFLKFAESDANSHFSDLAKRDEKFPRLKQAKYRVVITSGHRRKDDQNKLRDNRQHLKTLRDNQHNQILFKPLAGVFDLWEDSKLRRELSRGKDKRDNQGLADGYVWPPRQDEKSQSIGGHSAPGRLLEIAIRLVDRAERLYPEVRTVTDCVHGAVLATDALELLAERTPTSSLEALMLKHRFEVLAECQFCGVQDNLDVQSRFKDIKQQVASLSYWFDPKRENYIKWNAEAAIISKLILIYREYNSFDEEHAALAYSRTLHRKMWFHKKRWAFAFEPFAWYVEYLLDSLPRFIVVMGSWILVIGLLFHILEPSKPLLISILASYESFLGVQAPPDSLGKFNNGIIMLAIFGGFVHLGVFISHLYSIVSRK